MSDYAFGLKNPRDFLRKAYREVLRLELAEAELAEAADVRDHAINAVWSIWHVADWIARCPDPAYVAAIERIRQESRTPKKKPIEILHDYIQADANMALCDALANGAKHFELYNPPRFASTQVLTPASLVHSPAAPVALESYMSAMPSVRTGNQLQGHLPKLKINDVPIPALDVFKAALDYWDRFFAKYGL